MTVADAVWILALAFAQVAVLWASQKALPEYYFASAQFFLTRGEFKWKAVLFRLAIPFTAGVLVPLLPGVENDRLVAVLSGFLAWFLILWPIAWAPRLMVPPLKGVRWIIALWLGWWVFFTVLPLGGVAVMTWIKNVLNDPDSSWWESALAGELLFVIPFGILAFLFTWGVNKRVPRLGDEQFEEQEEWSESEDFDHYERRSMSLLEPAEWHFTAALFSVMILPFLVIALIVAVLRRGNR